MEDRRVIESVPLPLARVYRRFWNAVEAAYYHSASARRSLLNAGLGAQRLSAGRAQIIFCLGELTGDICTAVLKQG